MILFTSNKQATLNFIANGATFAFGGALLGAVSHAALQALRFSAPVISCTMAVFAAIRDAGVMATLIGGLHLLRTRSIFDYERFSPLLNIFVGASMGASIGYILGIALNAFMTISASFMAVSSTICGSGMGATLIGVGIYWLMLKEAPKNMLLKI